MPHKFKIGEPVRHKNRQYRVVARLPETGAQEPRYRIRNEEVVEGDEKVVVERDLRNPGGAERLRAPRYLTTEPRKARRPERVASDRSFRPFVRYPADGSRHGIEFAVPADWHPHCESSSAALPLRPPSGGGALFAIGRIEGHEHVGGGKLQSIGEAHLFSPSPPLGRGTVKREAEEDWGR
jgi:hypothetical protein